MGMSENHRFSAEELHAVYRAIRERRDVRSGFLPEPLQESTLLRLLEAAHCAPSVGLMQPARFIVIRAEATRIAVHRVFQRANEAASAIYDEQRRQLYGSLKLQGLLEAPQHLCVVCDERSSQGHGLGKQSMPRMPAYSVACAVQNLWIAGRAEGVGVGWVSILDTDELKNLLRIPREVELVAYLAIGYVDQFAERPDLERDGWETRRELSSVLRMEYFDQPYTPAPTAVDRGQ
jgi:5,6-dimethylbenzimidazole synthase